MFPMMCPHLISFELKFPVLLSFKFMDVEVARPLQDEFHSAMFSFTSN